MIRLLALALAFFCTTHAMADMQKVFVNQFVLHPALDMTVKGIVDGLEREGYKNGVNLDLRIETAQASSVLASQITSKFIGQGADIIVGVSTVSAQSVAKYARAGKTKLVFSSVTDPVQAGLVKNIEHPGNNTSGVSNFVPLLPQLELFKEIQPDLKLLGFIYNPSEANSISMIKSLNEAVRELGIELVVQSAAKTSDVAQAAIKLVKSVDAVFISNDNTALAALSVIISQAKKLNKPVYVSDIDMVSMGALAALGPNQYQLGIRTASIVALGLRGEDVGSIPVEFVQETELHLNDKMAQELGIVFSEQLKDRADKIFKDDVE